MSAKKNTKVTKVPECIGEQGSDAVLFDGGHTKCLECDIFDKCHKIATARSLYTISSELIFIVQNGIQRGWLLVYNELEKLRETKVSDAKNMNL